MAVLSTTQRNRIKKGMMRWWSARRVQCTGWDKDDLYDNGANTGAVANTDQWLEDAGGNPAPSTGYNGALTGNFGSNATGAMKAELLLIVAAVRAAVKSGQSDSEIWAERIVLEDMNG